MLVGIGVAKHDKKDKESDTLYQDDVTAPLEQSFDNDAARQDEVDEEVENEEGTSVGAIQKVCPFLFDCCCKPLFT